MSAAERVRITRSEHVAEVVLSRPEKRNAVDAAMMEALVAAGRELAQDPDVRAVILRGEGEAFCAGIDLNMLAGLAGDLARVKAEMTNPPPGEVANLFQKPCTVWSEVPAPVIAVVHGVAFGAGCQLALGADFRFAAPDARMSIMESKWGLIPDMGITQFLPALMRADQAKELIMTARILSAEEAQRYGLLTRVSPDPLAEARRFAAELAGRSPEAVRGAKRLVDACWSPPPAERLALEALLQADIIGTPNQLEAVMANMQKRAPRFT